MKKNRIFIAAACCALAALALSGCKNNTSDGGIGTTEHIYEERDVADYNDDGELILTSTDYRQVYVTDPGTYLIVVLGDSGPSSITIVKDFGTSDAAVEYITNGGRTLMESGEYCNLNLNGKYVTYSPTMTNEKYGKYFRMSKSEAEAALSAYVKQ